MKRKEKGITLIALVITIIVMLILVGVTINVAMQGGLFANARKAVADTQYEKDKEMLLSSVIGAMNKDTEVDFDKLDENLPEGFKKAEDGGYTSEAGNTFYVDKNGNITDEKVVTPETTGSQITADGKTVTLTRENVADYLGKKVKNYTGQPSVKIGSITYNVSTEYRLYYVDFEGKYGEKGTIYLKAECSSEAYEIPTTAPKGTDVVKIQNLNPGLYNKEDENGMPIADQILEPPSDENDGMKAVKWLTNTNNWKDLKPTDYVEGISETDVNYIVGAPSLEMMMDSYNTHYKLTGDEKVTTAELESNKETRAKLYYQYPYTGDSNHYGYGVRSADVAQFGNCTSYYSVKTDAIGTMYFPGNSQYYWLASPSALNFYGVLSVVYIDGGYVYGYDLYNRTRAFCPLVSLKSSVSLTLE